MKTLDLLILHKMNPQNPEFISILKDLQAYETTLKTLGKTIKDAVFEKVLQLTHNDEVSCYIKNYEAHLIYLSNCIMSYGDTFKVAPESRSYPDYFLLLEQLSDIITSLLDFLNSYFTMYFDQDKVVPDTVKKKVKRRFALKIMEIGQLGDSFFHNRLLKTVLLPALEFQNDDPDNMATFRRIIYLEVLLSAVVNVLKTEKEEDVEEALKWKLIYLNFNSLLFFCYVQTEMQEITRLQRDGKGKIRILNWYLKQIKQSDEKAGFALNSQKMSVTDRLTGWIKEEISYIEKYPEINSEELDNALPASMGKIQTESSVPKMGVIIAILIKMGLVPETDRKNLVRIFTVFFQTSHAKTISEYSLYNKSTTLENGACEWAKGKLIEALNYLNHGL